MQAAARVTRAHVKPSDRASLPSRTGGARTGSRTGRGSTSGVRRGGRTRTSRGRPASKRARVSAPRRRATEVRCRSIFTTAVALLLVLTSVGLARVAVIARAAEMTIHADELTRRIKQERVEADQLEVDRSSLAAPSRIEAIAAETMRMGDPASVSYLTLPESSGEGQVGDASASGEATSGGRRLEAVVSALIAVSAGEAQSLLVGDLGLIGSR